MSKSSPSPPPAPKPQETANAQSSANIATAVANAQLNRVNQTTPWGSITYTQGQPGANGVPTYSSSIQLSPEQQALLQQQQQTSFGRNALAQQYLSQISGKPLDFSHLHSLDIRGQQYNGAVNANPPIAPNATSNPGSGQSGQFGDGGIGQAISAALAAAGVGGGGQQQTPPGQQQMQQPQSPAQQPAQQPTGDPYGTAGNLWGMVSPAGSGQWQASPDISKEPDWIKNQFHQITTNAGGDGGQDQTVMSLGSGANGVVTDQKGNQVVQIGDPNNLGQSGGWRIKDPSKVHYDPALGYVTDPGNIDANQSYHRGDWINTAAVLGGGLASMYGTGALAGADTAAPAAGASGDVAAMQGPGAFESGGNAFLNNAPVTDLSTQAVQPSVGQTMWNNLTSGRGLLGMNNNYTRGAGLLAQLLRSRSNTNGGGGR